MTIKLLTVGLIMTIILAGGGFVYVAQRFDAATEAATIAGLQAKHTEQKTKILENELHKFRAEFRKVSDGMKANSDLEPILKRLDTLEMDILDIDFDLNDRIDALVVSF